MKKLMKCLVCGRPVPVEKPEDRVCEFCKPTQRGQAVLADLAKVGE